MNDKQCAELHKSFNYTPGTVYCRAVFDQTLCWEPTLAGTNATQSCPPMKGLDLTKYAFRICNEDGKWFHDNRTELIDKGYTYYNECLNIELKNLLKVCNGNPACMDIAQSTRIIEMIGLTISFISLILSLIIFHKFRILRNNRTTIHKNLFLATLLQVLVRLIIYIDEMGGPVMENQKYLCEGCKVLLEFAKTAMFMWMFIEGLYLHNAITFTVFQEHSYIKAYYFTGWIAPFVLTAIWTISMVFSTIQDKCWFLYYFLPNYWIVEGPRLALIVVNFMFLLNIIRILVVKLKQTKTSEIIKVSKAVRAAIFLLPLMGISNILFIKDYRQFKEAWHFRLWAYPSFFLSSFQGFFIAVLYCFLNGEVRSAIRNSLLRYISLRYDYHKRNSPADTGVSQMHTDA